MKGAMRVYTNDFEEAFGDFLDRHEYDEAESALFGMVRVAFVAGWRAAGGTPPQSEKIYELLSGRPSSDAPQPDPEP